MYTLFMNLFVLIFIENYTHEINQLKIKTIPDRYSIRLSENVQIKLQVIGPAPLIVENNHPTDWLKSSNSLWKIVSVSKASCIDLGNKTEQWECTVTISPYSIGNECIIQLEPTLIRSGEERFSTQREWPKINIEVVSELNPGNSNPRPIYTSLPEPKPVKTINNRNYIPLIFAAVCLFSLLFIGIYWRMYSKKIAIRKNVNLEWVKTKQITDNNLFLENLTRLVELKIKYDSTKKIFFDKTITAIEKLRFSGNVLSHPDREKLTIEMESIFCD